MQNIINHPCLKYADDLVQICKPLKEINIDYFAHVYIDKMKQFSALGNKPQFAKHYLTNHYYNNDIHLSELKNFGKYIIWDAIDLDQKSRKINLEAKEFGIQHLFTIINHSSNGIHYYHFANNENSPAINQFYINNIDLLTAFTQYFNERVNDDKNLSSTYDIKFKIDSNAQFYLKNKDALSPFSLNKLNFLHFLSAFKQGTAKHTIPLQQLKCIQLLISGLSAKQIAHQLNLSKRTVENYLAKIRREFGFRNSREIIKHYSNLLNSENK